MITTKRNRPDVSKRNRTRVGELNPLSGKKQNSEWIRNRVESRLRNNTYSPSLETRLKIGDKNRGRVLSLETRQRMSEAQKGHTRRGWRIEDTSKYKGRIPYNKGFHKHGFKECEVCSKRYPILSKREVGRTRFCSSVCRGKYYSGENHKDWKGGITTESEKIRKSNAYIVWRDAVRRINNYTCQECGVRGGNLHVHHIKPFSTHPEIRMAIDNGTTLCVKCHRKIHSKARLKLLYP